MAVQGRADRTNFPFWLGLGQIISRAAETILQDAGRITALVYGTLMARVKVAIATTGTGDAGNAAGVGTVTAVALIAGTLPRVGSWVLECIVATAHGGTFKLVDPGGNVIRNDLVLSAGAGLATAFYIPEAGMAFTITDGATDFSVGEFFTVVVTAGTKWSPFDPDAVNGLQIPAGVYIGDDITAAALVAGDVVNNNIAVAGAGVAYDGSLLVIENSATLNTVLAGGKTVREALYDLGMFDQSTIDINALEN